MRYVEAPADAEGPGLFLAGGITDCPDWQAEAVDLLRDVDVTVFNPRRRAFPPAEEAETQIAWEYRHLRAAGVVLFWFCASRSNQPIVLFELGSHLHGRIAVGADPAYTRRVDVVTQLALARPDLTVHTTLPDTVRSAITLLNP